MTVDMETEADDSLPLTGLVVLEALVLTGPP